MLAADPAARSRCDFLPRGAETGSPVQMRHLPPIPRVLLAGLRKVPKDSASVAHGLPSAYPSSQIVIALIRGSATALRPRRSFRPAAR